MYRVALHWSLEFIDCSHDSNRLLVHFSFLLACLSLLACLLFHSPIRWNLNHQIYENMIKLELEIFRFFYHDCWLARSFLIARSPAQIIFNVQLSHKVKNRLT